MMMTTKKRKRPYCVEPNCTNRIPENPSPLPGGTERCGRHRAGLAHTLAAVKRRGLEEAAVKRRGLQETEARGRLRDSYLGHVDAETNGHRALEPLDGSVMTYLGPLGAMALSELLTDHLLVRAVGRDLVQTIAQKMGRVIELPKAQGETSEAPIAQLTTGAPAEG